MNTGATCARPVCGADCVAPPTETVSVRKQLGRAVGAAAAILCGVLVITAAAGLPGYQRVRRAGWAMRLTSRWILRSLGVRSTITGSLRSGPSLVVGNHVSFLDVLALCSAGSMRMIAKHEVAAWPLIGRAARRTGALFLRRDDLRKLPATVADITATLRAGHRVQVFPEATTRCGAAVNEFRRAAFQAALDAAVVVIPVTVTYRENGNSRSRSAPFVGDETLLTAMRRIIATPRLRVDVRVLPPIPAIPSSGHAATDRRNLALLAENAVARSLGQPVVRRVRTTRPRLLPVRPTIAA